MGGYVEGISMFATPLIDIKEVDELRAEVKALRSKFAKIIGNEISEAISEIEVDDTIYLSNKPLLVDELLRFLRGHQAKYEQQTQEG